MDGKDAPHVPSAGSLLSGGNGRGSSPSGSDRLNKSEDVLELKQWDAE